MNKYELEYKGLFNFIHDMNTEIFMNDLKISIDIERKHYKSVKGITLHEAIQAFGDDECLRLCDIKQNYIHDENPVWSKIRFIVKMKEKNQFNIQEIKLKPIEEILNSFGIKYKKKCLCPLHDERTPSFIIFKKTNTWKCFGCGKGGDNITFVKQKLNCNFVEACRYIQSL